MLIRFYKPFGVLSQFRDSDGRPTLADHIALPGVHPAGRLDHDSEGLMLLTDDGRLQARIAEPRHKLPKVYAAQVEAQPDAASFVGIAAQLVRGIALRDGLAHAVTVRQIEAPDLPDRLPAVTPHRAARSSWVEIVLTEGRNRQVRRMLAAIGLPVLRLIRTRIGPIDLEGLSPGAWAELSPPAVLTEHKASSGSRAAGRTAGRGRPEESAPHGRKRFSPPVSGRRPRR